jgi:hypothetical protein
VGNDNTVKYKRHTLQLLPDAARLHYAQVRVHEYPDGSLAVFHGPELLANKEESFHAFAAFASRTAGKKTEEEASTSPSPDSESHLGTQFRVTQRVSARA